MRPKVAAYIVSGAYSLGFLVYGISLPSHLTRVLSFLPTAVVVAFVIFDNLVWHWGAVLRLSKRPYISGTWRGELTSYRRDNHDQQLSDKRPVYLVIRQTATTQNVTMLTEQSRSRSSASQIVSQVQDEWQLQYQYLNTPELSARNRGSAIHPGGSVLEIGGLRPTTITGEYWTARETRGELSLTKLSKRHVHNFNEAKVLSDGGKTT